MARTAALVLLAMAVFGTSAASASAARQMRQLEPGVGFEADDSRYAVFGETWGLRIVDTVDHERTAFEYSRIPIGGGSDCSLGDAHAGFAVVNCYDPENYGNPRPWVVDLSTLDVVTPPGSPPLGKYSQPFEYYWVGIHWVAVFDGDAEAWVFWNWRTGVFKFVAGWTRRAPRDLDTPELLKRPPDLAAWEGRTGVWERQGRLELWHRDRHVLLALCPCSGDVALGGGRVAWTRGKFLTSYRIRDGRRIRWRIRGSADGYPEPRLLHTRNRLYVFNWYDVTGYATRWPPA
jgi:hypothetical protein